MKNKKCRLATRKKILYQSRDEYFETFQIENNTCICHHKLPQAKIKHCFLQYILPYLMYHTLVHRLFLLTKIISECLSK